MGSLCNWEGQTIGRWSIGALVGQTLLGRRAMWLCTCTCGTTETRVISNPARMKSCGCLLREKSSERAKLRSADQGGINNTNFRHGHNQKTSISPTYRTWSNMLSRCRNPKTPHWRDYGGRGIRVWDGWLDFKNFLADMGERPINKTLDRKDVNGNYAPTNCRWATPEEQIANRRKSGVLDRFSTEELLVELNRRGVSK